MSIRKFLWVPGAFFFVLAALTSDYITGLNSTLVVPAIFSILAIGFVWYSFGGT